MDTETSPDLEDQIALWRSYLYRHKTMGAPYVDELESHLRDQVDALLGAGLTPDEAFLVSVKRMGSLDALSREFAREHSDRLWKQLVLAPEDQPDGGSRFQFLPVLGLAVAAALAVKLPVLFGIPYADDNEAFYARNLSFFVLPLLMGYFAWKRRLPLSGVVFSALAFLAAAAVVNLYPYVRLGHTEILTVLHLPIALWAVVGVAYTGGAWRSSLDRMNFVRFSGELFIYYVLIALGGGVLTASTFAIFESIGLDPEGFVSEWLVPCGAAGAFIIAAWLVEAKQSVIENMAPVLTRVFTPLFTLLLLAFLGTMLWTGSGIDVAREVLIVFDLLLVVVVALLLYAVSAREAERPPDLFDALQLVLIVSALVVDVLALGAMAGRISAFGFSPNKLAALGLNLILLVHLGGAAWLYVGFLRRRLGFGALERWQTSYLPVYVVWAAVVVVVFPPLFGWV